ncbi:hypothetical protein P152DRAFT_404513 [Eremomyces bilateralis CBS 781.70]|uniref:Calcineurin-like phosphoesterase domain-containing protein n=1 Tax=Eremomyces bilateralis CBS 781.70 TaxID=1392243 RepID=A0A6G1FT18_9PEZI|nr:uncharacterized protein P152DRAFT_404513 [Eremomyces bilateralis CBS 781.70]KAF1808876.1 hypothetical protein P152DRAFT_404513 [Eremomyces bilateralis CBS 781.70]
MARTSLLVISDTHGETLKPKDSEYAFRKSPPPVDVVLHCGDLTMSGLENQHRRTIELMKSLKADLKLVIAGNHDASLDPDYWAHARGLNTSNTTPETVRQMWEDAKFSGIYYLPEGHHTFTIPRTGARLSIYASPYTPEFCGMAFAYERSHDRFSLQEDCREGVRSISEHPIPDFPSVDVVMTHGPPWMARDWVVSGERVGCRNLLNAVARVRPKLCCFGHIHEGWGVEKVTWPEEKDPSEERVADAVKSTEQFYFEEEEAISKRCVEVDVSGAGPGGDTSGDESKSKSDTLKFGKQTLMVNAAIMTVSYRPKNAPILVHLDLPLPEPESMDWTP